MGHRHQGDLGSPERQSGGVLNGWVHIQPGTHRRQGAP
jgi:hypothetical protein